MAKGKLIVFEGIYGSGKYVVRLVNRLREALAAEKREVYEIDSPDSGRAQLMGAASSTPAGTTASSRPTSSSSSQGAPASATSSARR